MISKVFASHEVQMKTGWPSLPVGEFVVADWSLVGSICTVCGEKYNHSLLISETRPVLERVDDALPTLYVVPGVICRSGEHSGGAPTKLTF